MKKSNNEKPNAQIYSHWGVLKNKPGGGSRICYYDSYGNLCGLVCVMPKDVDWPGSTKNAEFIVKLFNEYRKKEN